MKQFLLILAILFFPVHRLAGQKSYYYYGPNGRPLKGIEKAITYKEVKQKSAHKYVIKSYNLNDNTRILNLKEIIRIGEDYDQEIHYFENTFFPKKRTREIEKMEEDRYMFTEKVDDHVERTGESSGFIPLQLEGTVTEFYPNNSVKSISQYYDNQLISNENWLPDGEKYIDNIFYSVDIEPTYEYGDGFFKGYLIEKLKESQIDLSQVQDKIVIGWVIMEDGELDGVVVLQGRIGPVIRVLTDAITELPGTWQPAVLGDSAVRYFMNLPFNFSQNDVRFQEIDFSEGMMHYNKY